MSVVHLVVVVGTLLRFDSIVSVFGGVSDLFSQVSLRVFF